MEFDTPDVLVTACRAAIPAMPEIGTRQPRLNAQGNDWAAPLPLEFLQAENALFGQWFPEWAVWSARYGKEIMNRRDRHLLVMPAAGPGHVRGLLLQAWLRHHRFPAQVVPVPGLAPFDAPGFQAGLAGLARWCGLELTPLRQNAFHVVFQADGESGLLGQALASLAPWHAHELLLEDGFSLMMPEARLGQDRDVRRNLFPLRRMQAGLPVDEEELVQIPEGWLLSGSPGKEVRLAMAGELAWDQCWRALYGERLLEPISDRMLVSTRFHDSAAGLAADRRVLLNHRLDQLAVRLELGEGHNPPELNFRALPPGGLTGGPATHDCHGWADDGLWRIRGHYEGTRFILDRLERKGG